MRDWRDRGSADRDEGLHICPECNSRLVQPAGPWEWAEIGVSWKVSLWCPDCRWTGKRICTNDEADRYDEALEEGREAMDDDVKDIVCPGVEEMVGSFATALAEDLITAEDFGSGSSGSGGAKPG